MINILMLWRSLAHVAPFMTHEIAVDLVGRGTCSPMWRTNSKEAFTIAVSDVSLTSYGYEPSTLLLFMVIAVFF